MENDITNPLAKLSKLPFTTEQERNEFFIGIRRYSFKGMLADEIGKVANFLKGRVINHKKKEVLRNYINECVEIINDRCKSKYHLEVRYFGYGVDGNGERCSKYHFIAVSEEESKQVCDIYVYRIKNEIHWKTLRAKRTKKLYDKMPKG